jgi:phosphoribosylformylglycinamidine synthase I
VVVVFPGSNCDRDAAHAFRAAGGDEASLVWHQDFRADPRRLVILPGGFSYGDYLRAGALAAVSPALAEVRRHLEAGGLALGICNGFQILVEAGLLPGAFRPNRDGRFHCEWVHLRVESSASPFAADLRPGEVLRLPIAHGEGNYFLPEDEVDRLEAEGRIAFRYVTADGLVTDEANPNGSVANIAGVYGYAGRLLGLMPHPERAAEAVFGSRDGARILAAAARHLQGVAS